MSPEEMPSPSSASTSARCSPLMTVSKAMPRSVCVWGSKKNLGVPHVLAGRGPEICVGQVVKVLGMYEHRGASIVEVEE